MITSGGFSLIGVEDGKGNETIFSLTSTFTPPERPSTVNADGHIPSGWFSSPQDVSSSKPYQWISKREKEGGIWGLWSQPSLYSNFADSSGYEYCYKSTSSETRPSTPVSSNVDGSVPSGWSSTLLDLSAANPFIWESQRKKESGIWSVWSTPKLKGRWANDGSRGAKMRMRTWMSGTEYLSGAGGEDFYDVVVFQNLLYLCLKRHTAKIGTNDPVTSITQHDGFWEAAQDWTFVATKLLLAEKINASQIDATNLVADGITAKDANITGTINATGGTFTGAIKKKRLNINQSNYSTYFQKRDTGYYLNLDRAGLYINLSGILPFSVILLPVATSYDLSYVRETAIAYVGNKAIIYNRTSSDMGISGIMREGSSVHSSMILHPNYVAILECDYCAAETSNDTQNFERIGWKCKFNKIAVQG